jgi:hypothetical protein
MKKFATLLAVLALVGAAGAADYSELGYSEDTIVISDQSDQCSGVMIYNHDFSFENGYCWQYGGIVPPYYGCFAEGFDVGAVNVECGLYWLSQIGYYMGQPLDAYVWAGGVTGPPGDVLCVTPGVTGLNIGYWPSCTMNEVEIGCCVPGEFTTGYWADFSAMVCQWYCCADLNGFGGFPWTCIAPGIGYPTGWQDPTLIWGTTQSMAIGATVTDDPSPAESQTWGSIKSLFE